MCSVIAKITEIYNGGIKLDWKDGNICKYYPYKYFDSGSYRVSVLYTYFSSFLYSARFYYKSEKLTSKSYENFKEFWEDYWSVK